MPDELTPMLTLYIAAYAQVKANKNDVTRAAYRVASRLYTDYLMDYVWPDPADKAYVRHFATLQENIENAWL